MKFQVRPLVYERDIAAMSELVHASPAYSRHVVDLPYRLSSPALQTADNVRLWEDSAGRLAAWAVWQAPFISLDIGVRPDARRHGIEEQVLDWGVQRFQEIAREKGERLHYFVDAHEDDADRIALLKRAGFVSAAHWQQLHLRRSLAEPAPVPQIPDGFTIRHLSGQGDVEAYVSTHRAAFASTNMTVEWRTRTLHTPQYIPDLDLLAFAPDGRCAAFCLCWLDTHDHDHVTAQVEPLGVHPDFQRLGLGRAMLFAGLQQMHAHGARTAYIEVDSVNDRALPLYTQSGGFNLEYTALKYYLAF